MALFERTVEVAAGKIRIGDSRGNRFPLVFLHGSGFSRSAFVKQTDSFLAEKYRLVLIDLPGHGDSDNFPGDCYSVSGMASIVATVLNNLDIAKCVVVGWSLGGHVAIELAAQSGVVAGLVLTGTPPVSPGLLSSLFAFRISRALVLAGKERLTASEAELYVKKAFNGLAVPSATIALSRADGIVRKTFSKSLLSGDGVKQRMFIESTEIPICFINGADDPFLRLPYLNRLKVKHLYGGKPITLPLSGHAAFQTLDATYNKTVDSFIESIPEGMR